MGQGSGRASEAGMCGSDDSFLIMPFVCLLHAVVKAQDTNSDTDWFGD